MRTIALAVLIALALPGAAQANEGFAAITSNGRLATFTEQSRPSLLTYDAVTSATRHARIVALDRLPDGRLLALDGEGRICDLDLGAARLTPRYGGRALTGPLDSPTSLTFTVANDGASALIVNRDVPWRVDLASGDTRRVPKPTTGGAQESLALDTLPDGRLFGLEGGGHSVVRESAPDSGRLVRVGPLPNVIDQTRFTLGAGGGAGWIVTRLSKRDNVPAQSRWMRVDTQTGAVSGKDGPFFLRAFDAVAALGDRPEVTARPTAHVSVPRTVSRRQLARDRGLVFTVRASQGGQTVASLRDQANRNRGFGFATTDLPNRGLRVHVFSTAGDQRRLAPRFRVHIAVHGVNDQVRLIDRYVRVTG